MDIIYNKILNKSVVKNIFFMYSYYVIICFFYHVDNSELNSSRNLSILLFSLKL